MPEAVCPLFPDLPGLKKEEVIIEMEEEKVLKLRGQRTKRE